MTEEALPPPRPRRSRPVLRVIRGGPSPGEKESTWWTPYGDDHELEFLGPFDYLPTLPGCMEITGPVPDEAFYMSEPDFGFEDEDTPERMAEHAAWLKDYCEKNRSTDT